MEHLELAIVAVLLFLVGLRVVLVTVLGLLIIRPVRDCPACFEPTVAIRKPLLTRFVPRFEWRWCATCGWEGPARRISERFVRTRTDSSSSQSEGGRGRA